MKRRGMDGGDGDDDDKAKAKAMALTWQLEPSSRICRVSRDSGGKDRHSKVITSKGLRDRRVRLSVPTAIQFYGLQDRLGFDQPSKALDWLLHNASHAISQLPSLDHAFANLSRSLQTAPDNSSASSSNASITEPSDAPFQSQKHNSQGSFSGLLSGVLNCAGNGAEANAVARKQPHDVVSTADLLMQQTLRALNASSSPSGYSFPSHFSVASVSAGAVQNSEIQQQFAFLHHVLPVAEAVAVGGDCGIGFSVAPGLTGLNSRGTLQSNLSSTTGTGAITTGTTSQFHQIQMFPLHLDSHALPLLFTAGVPSSPSRGGMAESSFMGGLDARLELYHGDGYHHSGFNAKRKN